MKLWLLSQHSPNGASSGVGTFGVSTDKLFNSPNGLNQYFSNLFGSFKVLPGDFFLVEQGPPMAVPAFFISTGNYLQTIDTIVGMGEDRSLKFGEGAEEMRTKLIRKIDELFEDLD